MLNLSPLQSASSKWSQVASAGICPFRAEVNTETRLIADSRLGCADYGNSIPKKYR
jgi:hypothetical protein